MAPGSKRKARKLDSGDDFPDGQIAGGNESSGKKQRQKDPPFGLEVCIDLASGSMHEIRTMASYIGGQLVYGKDLENAVKRDRDISATIMDYFKLCLDDSDNKDLAPIKERINRILARQGKTVDNLFTDYLSAIDGAIKSAIEKTHERSYFRRHKTEFEEAYAEKGVRITIPQMWSPNARRRMQEIAKAAGLTTRTGTVVLAHEPKCALAHILSKMARDEIPVERQLRKGDVVSVVDLGSGTGDFALYRLSEDLSESSQLEPIGQATGGLCGSSRVDRILYNNLAARMNQAQAPGADTWIAESAQFLNVTEDDFRRRALNVLEGLKTTMSEGEGEKLGFIIGDNLKNVSFLLYEKEVKRAIDDVVVDIVSEIDQLQTKLRPRERVALMSITGGFSKSDYLYQRLWNRYGKGRNATMVVKPTTSEVADQYPVAVGGLERYTEIRGQGLPWLYGCAFLFRMHFQPELAVHKDAFEYVNGKIKTKPWVLSSPHDSTKDILDDRIHNIIRKGTPLHPGQIVKGNIFHLFYIPQDHPRFGVELVYLSEDLKDGEASRDHEAEEHSTGYVGDRDVRRFKEGVHRLKTIEIAVETAKLEGYAIDEGGDYPVEGRFIVQRKDNSEDLKIGMEIRKPRLKADGTQMEGDDGKSEFAVMEDLWDSAHSEFVEP